VSFPRPRFLRLYAAPLDGAAAGSSGLALILHDATEARQKTFEAIESERIQALTLLAASVAHEIGILSRAAHSLQLMERQIKKLRFSPSGPVASRRLGRAQAVPAGSETDEIAQKLEQYLNVAKGEINRLDYIITQFLQAIRPTPPQPKPASLSDVVEETLTLLRPELDNRGLTVKEKLARQLPNAPLDAGQVQQVLVNLIKNAMQAMTRGGTLTLQTGEGSDGVWVSVADTGGGIAQEQINRIFDPFYTTKKKGTGLGLMIVQRIVRAHGGRIELESHVGRGTTFRVWFPLHERPTRLLAPWKRSEDKPASHRGKTDVVIVDDEKPTREGLRAALEDRYDVYVAEDAQSAIELLEREHFRVLLTDFRLPNEDGMKLITRAKSLSRPPVCILMTAYGSRNWRWKR